MSDDNLTNLPRIRPTFAVGALIVCAVLVADTPVAAQTAALTAIWDANPETDLAGYILRYGTQPDVADGTEVNVGNVTSYSLTVPIGQTYYFVVKAYDANGNVSTASARASGGVFTDRPLVAGATAVKAAHVTELRNRINAARVVRSLATYAWSEPVMPSSMIKAQHVTEMRAALAEAFAAESLAPPTYTDSPLSSGMVVRAVHFSQLRGYLEQLEATP